MASKSVQERFGQVVIDGLTNFAKNGIPEVSQLDSNWFEHVQDKNIRDALTDTLYGARWLYKVGLALQVQDKELFAHVRSQVIDYVSICETLLIEMISHAHAKKKLTGNQWKYKDIPPNSTAKSIHKIKWWNFAKSRNAVIRQSFKWCIVVSQEDGIIDALLGVDLDKMRTFRNTVHITERALANPNYSLSDSAEAFKVMQRTISQKKIWFNNNVV